MGVLYEHWRPDLNECFYVGVSWANGDTRPYELSNRNEDHIKVQKELVEKGLDPEIRIIDCPSLSKKDLHQLERYQIVYWKDLVGDRLTNKANGGQGVHSEWTQEMREAQRQRMFDFLQTEAGEAYCKAHSVRTKDYLSNLDEEDWEEFCDKVSEGMKRYYASEAGYIRREEDRQRKLDFYASEEGQIRREEYRQRGLALYASEEGQIRREEDRQRKLDFYASEEGERLKTKDRNRMLSVYASDKGVVRRKADSERIRGGKNPGAKTSEFVAQSILDFLGTHEEAAEIYNVPIRRARAIRERKTWKHLIPTRSDTGNETSN
jgi:hypothetical protein